MTDICQVLSTLPGNVLGRLRQADRRWYQLRHQSQEHVPQVVRESAEPLGQVDGDVVICGGTLGS